jgi:Pectate lyase superfamily protein
MPDVRISELPLATFPADADLAPLVQANGSGGNETRRASVAQLRGALLADRGAHVRDYGAKGDGAADDAPAIQAAIHDLKTRGGGTLLFGPRTYRIASPVVVVLPHFTWVMPRSERAGVAGQSRRGRTFAA